MIEIFVCLVLQGYPVDFTTETCHFQETNHSAREYCAAAPAWAMVGPHPKWVTVCRERKEDDYAGITR